MPFPHIVVRLPGGRSVSLQPGAIIGRMPTATGRVQDPRISEAHALVTLRGRELRLLALRGALIVDGQAEDDLILVPGLLIGLVPGLSVLIERVELPEEVTGVCLDGALPIELAAPVHALVVRPHIELLPRFEASAAALIWATGEDWTLQLRGQPPVPLRPDGEWTVEGVHLRATRLAAAVLSNERTVTTRPSPLTLVNRHTSVHVLRARREPFVVDGLPGRVLSEVAACGAPVAWSVVAGEIWPETEDLALLRQSWDRAMRRLRSRLREGAVREDLVRPDGCGNVELVLNGGDSVIDEG